MALGRPVLALAIVVQLRALAERDIGLVQCTGRLLRDRAVIAGRNGRCDSGSARRETNSAQKSEQEKPPGRHAVALPHPAKPHRHAGRGARSGLCRLRETRAPGYEAREFLKSFPSFMMTARFLSGCSINLRSSSRFPLTTKISANAPVSMTPSLPG